MSSTGASDRRVADVVSALVLLSGGIDSCATLALYKRRTSAVTALFVNYGQSASTQERVSASSIAAHYGVPLTIVDCTGIGTFGTGYVRARNALLLQIALASAPFEAGQVAIGIHGGTPYVDCSAGFIAEAQRIFDVYCDGKIRIVAPFMNDDKRGVLGFCRESDVPIGLTYSCERGGEQPCGTCLSCQDRRALGVL